MDVVFKQRPGSMRALSHNRKWHSAPNSCIPVLRALNFLAATLDLGQLERRAEDQCFCCLPSHHEWLGGIQSRLFLSLT